MCFLDWVGLSSIFATVDSELPEECVLKKGITTMEDYCWSVLQLVALVTLVCAVPVCGELTSEGVNYEVQALMAIKLELIDPQGCLSGWDSSSVDPCSWFHVTCSNNQSVIELNIASRGLSGLLSSNVGNLTNLLYLSLQNNNISGSIPAELGKLSKLSSLDLSNNLFSGKIPQALGQIQGLTYLRLNNNNLSGVIPMSLSAVHVLDYVDLSNNNLSGHVPHLSAKTLIVAGNPLLCGSTANQECRGDSPLQMPLPLASKDTNHAKSRKLIIAIGPAISIVLFGFVVFAFILWRRHHNQPIFYDVSEQQDPEVCLGQLKKFGFRELQIATDHFHPRNIIGSGGFGDVYKGHLTDGSVVAVKRFMKNRINAGGEMQFQTEIEMISVAVHRNLLRLIGYCVTPTERILVYPYMCNGSVASCLKKKPALDWPTRKRIALGTARGLLYLHEQCDPKIIHRDVKAANILLDEDYEAVVGDFGLAKLLNHNESHATTAVRGTLGHIAPEYLSTGKTSEKTDVFGFGILLLELITGQRASNLGHLSNLPNQKGYAILNWVKKLQQEKRLCEMLDSELNGDCNEAELEELVQVALLCTQFSPLDRPKMSEVMCMLVGDGLVERWDAWQKAEAEHSGSEPWSQRYFDLVENSLLIEEMDGASFTLEALELSAPR